MSKSVIAALLALVPIAGLVAWSPAAAANAPNAPIRVVEEALPIPAGMDTEAAMASVVDISQIFQLYEPVIPKVPGVRLDLDKEVVSIEGPTILELPVSGAAFGHRIDERARVTAHAEPTACTPSGVADGRKITLDFESSSYNIERRIDRIEITACPAVDKHGNEAINAVGRMYEGYKPKDPSMNPISEAIGAQAFQGAFIKQVPAVLSAVKAHWASLRR